MRRPSPLRHARRCGAAVAKLFPLKGGVPSLDQIVGSLRDFVPRPRTKSDCARRFVMRRIFLSVLTLIFLATPAAAATDPVAKCTAAKVKAAGKKYAGKTKCEAKAILKAEAVDPACISKVESKYMDAMAKAESGAACAGDAISIEASVDSCLTDLLDEVTADVGDACADNADCGDFTCQTGFPGGYCTVEGCPAAGSTGGCPTTESICTDPVVGANYCA